MDVLLLKLVDEKNQTIIINMSNVQYFEKTEIDDTLIAFSGDNYVRVKTPIAEIEKMLNPKIINQ
jgi:competence transcription factor ComK